MDRTNVPRRRLGRGGRGSGVRRRGAVRLPQHDIDAMNVVDIETLPRGQPQERPLGQKRRRGLDSRPSSLHIAPPMSSLATEASEVDGADGISELDLPTDSTLSPGAYCVVSNGGSATSPATALSAEQCPQPLQMSLRDDDIVIIPGYGSESDMSGESDSEELVPLIPKALRSLMETPLDEGATPPTASDWCTTQPEDSTTSTSTTSASYETPLGPSFYDFQWKSFPDPCIPPESRRETFSNSNVGPTAPCVDPYDTFVSIWDRQIMEHIASETNRYAQELAQKLLNTNDLHPNSRIASWRDTNVDELYAYLAILLAMGIVVKGRIEEYWSSTPDIFYTPGFSAQMPIRRFQLLSRCLHFVNNEDMYASKLDVYEAKLFKIKPVVEHLNKKFQESYNLGQNISLDESLLLWKGSLSINQLIPNKAASVGIKTYEVCESQTGYLWRFVVHSHKSQPSLAQAEDPLETFTSAIVLRLIQGLENKGHTLWMDNYYNSPALARKLKTLGFDCVGTLRTNRQFVPAALNNLTKGKMHPGQIAGFTSGDVDVMVWRDQNRVGMISTYHGNAVAVREGYTKPTLILDYNIMMGGVDKKDQMLSMYPVERKRTKVWYKKIFRRLLNVSVLNAYIICKGSSSSLDHRSFRTTLIKSILNKHSAPSTTAEPAPRRDGIFEVRHHHLAEYPVANLKTNRSRRRCEVCKKRTYTFCVGCKKTFCMIPCFISAHP